MNLPNFLTISRLFLAAVLMALLAFSFPFTKTVALLVFVVAGITELIMFVAYFFYDLLFVSYSVAIKAVPINLLQAAVCGALGALVLRYVPIMHPDKMLEIRRRARPRYHQPRCARVARSAS